MVLRRRECMLAARSRTYFWGKRADAAVDYGLGRAGVRGICCFGHGERLCSNIVIVYVRGRRSRRVWCSIIT
jgi:hypothetical protein